MRRLNVVAVLVWVPLVSANFFRLVVSGVRWHRIRFRFLWPCIVSKVCREKNQQDATIRYLLLTSISTCFGHHYAHLPENKDRVTAFGVLFWFWWMWLVAVVGRCIVGCEHCPKHVEIEVNNKHLTVSSWWFFSLHRIRCNFIQQSGTSTRCRVTLTAEFFRWRQIFVGPLYGNVCHPSAM